MVPADGHFNVNKISPLLEIPELSTEELRSGNIWIKKESFLKVELFTLYKGFLFVMSSKERIIPI